MLALFKIMVNMGNAKEAREERMCLRQWMRIRMAKKETSVI